MNYDLVFKLPPSDIVRVRVAIASLGRYPYVIVYEGAVAAQSDYSMVLVNATEDSTGIAYVANGSSFTHIVSDVQALFDAVFGSPVAFKSVNSPPGVEALKRKCHEEKWYYVDDKEEIYVLPVGDYCVVYSKVHTHKELVLSD